jgi:peptidoglycan/LPS O-acetylase OafA/YrhL
MSSVPPVVPDKLPFLNGLRGVAVLGVIWQHLFWIFNIPGEHPFGPAWLRLAGNPLASNGWMGVNLFFFCSGFVLYLPYRSGRRKFSSRRDLFWFWRHRAERLLPLFYFSLLVGVGVSVTAQEFTHPSVWAALFMALSGLFIFCPWTFMPIGNGVLWSLGVEVLFSAVFPFLERGMRRIGAGRLLVATAALGLLCRVLGYGLFREQGLYLNFASDGILGRLDDFVWGMVCAAAYVTGRLPQTRLTMPLGAALMLFSAVVSDWWFAGWVPYWMQAFNFTLFSAGVFLLVSGLLLHDSWLRRCLEFRPLQVIGMMCFSIYAWHAILYTQMYSQAERLSLHAVLQGLPAYLLLVGGVAIVSYRFVEFPKKDWREIFLLRPAP